MQPVGPIPARWRAADGRAAQVDGGDGGAAGGRSSAAAAVHHFFHLGLRRGAGKCARWFAASQPVEALVVDDTGFAKDGDASPCVARQYSGTLGKTANCQVAVSVHLVNEHASCAADWRLFCPASWDDQALADPVAAAGAAQRRQRAGIPAQVRHREKWRLALDMIDEMAGPGGWGVLDLVTAAGGARPVVAADIAYGDNALFREQLTATGWQYAVAVKGSTTAHDGGVVPQARTYGVLGQPPKPACPQPPATLRQLALAHAAQARPVTWRQGTKTSKNNPEAAMTSCFLAIWSRSLGPGRYCSNAIL
ncbi:MAG TPA: transposase [Streptosporangiaceae bacterium]|nr:transposase [Streptosporangiaceae bacterium]